MRQWHLRRRHRQQLYRGADVGYFNPSPTQGSSDDRPNNYHTGDSGDYQGRRGEGKEEPGETTPTEEAEGGAPSMGTRVIR
jgi:hypothetical protein